MLEFDRRHLETLAVVIALGLLLGGCFMILAPFVPALLWAAIFVFSTRNVYRRLNILFGGRDMLTATLFVFAFIALIMVPLLFAAVSFASDATNLAARMTQQLQSGIPPLPEWVVDAPWIGGKIDAWWSKLAAGDSAVRTQLNTALLWLAKGLLHVGVVGGQGLGMLLLSCVIAIFFYASMNPITVWLRAVMQRISGPRAEQLLEIAGGTVQGVVFGILGTAVAQGVLTGMALFIADVPGAAGLTLAAIVLSLLPGGAVLIWLPAALWLHHEGDTSWAWFMVVWGMGVVGTVDNLLKPLLIGQSSDLPFLLIMFGVLGGAMSFGFLGVFLGPTLLALGYALLREWLLGKDLRVTWPPLKK
jgi:predicted PurR-regulated permease PerM